MIRTSSHHVEFRIDDPTEEFDDMPGSTATRPQPATQPDVWSVTARDVAELHGILERLQTAGYTLISIDVE